MLNCLLSLPPHSAAIHCCIACFSSLRPCTAALACASRLLARTCLCACALPLCLCSLVVAFSVFSGVEPPLASVKGLPVVNWLWYLSFSTWTAEGTYVVWAHGSVIDGSGASGMAERVAAGAAYFGYDISSQTRSILALLGIGLAWRAVAAAVMWSLAPLPRAVGTQALAAAAAPARDAAANISVAAFVTSSLPSTGMQMGVVTSSGGAGSKRAPAAL